MLNLQCVGSVSGFLGSLSNIGDRGICRTDQQVKPLEDLQRTLVVGNNEERGQEGNLQSKQKTLGLQLLVGCLSSYTIQPCELFKNTNLF